GLKHDEVQAGPKQGEALGEHAARGLALPGAGGPGDSADDGADVRRAKIVRIMRIDGRRLDEMRPVEITTGYLMTAEGSEVISVGNTRVLCAASVEESVPQFLRGSGKGWVTAEYSMLPR